ncbi:MAG: DUF1190 domain-containing protein [Endozoicomonas sp.]
MRRSKKLRLALLGVTPLALAGCGNSAKEALVYSSVENCANDGVVSANICKIEYNKAWQHHLMNAPRYTFREDCQKDFNSTCQPLSSGEYIPTMEGFMLTSAQQQGSSRSFTVIPLYLGGGGYFRTGGYERIGSTYKQGKTTVSSTADRKVKPTLRSTTMKRGGFGSRSAARGGWGG